MTQTLGAKARTVLARHDERPSIPRAEAWGDPPGPEPVPPELAQLLAEAAPYRAGPVRPWTRTLLRASLWAMVAAGAVGGVVGLSSLGDDPPVVRQAAEDVSVPAPVGGMAELAVEEWLTTTEADAWRLEPLFVEPPALPPARATDGRQLLWSRTVAGEQVTDGYWSVTVRVDLVDVDRVGDEAPADEAPSDGAPGDEAPGDEAPSDGASGDEAPAEGFRTWYVEVGIVGQENGALAALRTPAVMPPPAGLEDGWSSHDEDAVEARTDDALWTTVEDFLRARLAGQGDPDRYVASGVELPAADPALFTELELTELTSLDLGRGALRAQAEIEAVTPDGATQTAAYEVVLQWRGDRLEVLEMWGAPSLAGRPSAPDEAGAENESSS